VHGNQYTDANKQIFTFETHVQGGEAEKVEVDVEEKQRKKDDRRAYKEVIMKSKKYKAERKRTKAQYDRMREEV
jgi:hypothetical protein